MEGYRQKSGGGRRRRRKAKPEPKGPVEPVMIAARRPNAPVSPAVPRSSVAASASPSSAGRNGRGAGDRLLHGHAANGAAGADLQPLPSGAQERPRRARMVQLHAPDLDDAERLRQKLLDRLLSAEGRGQISRVAEEFQQEGYTFPEEQGVQLQLLEHFDEGRALEAVQCLKRILDREPATKRPILEQRLRRLEEYADEAPTREAAANLRRMLRAS